MKSMCPTNSHSTHKVAHSSPQDVCGLKCKHSTILLMMHYHAQRSSCSPRPCSPLSPIIPINTPKTVSPMTPIFLTPRSGRLLTKHWYVPVSDS